MTAQLLPQNYFDLFDLKPAYTVELSQLQEKYRALQNVTHPDRYTNASSQERRLSMQQTSIINEAYQTLKDPIRRAVYLIQLGGRDLNLENETTSDAEFLMDQMEQREQLVEVRSASDPLEKLDNMARQNQNKMNLLVESFEQAFDQSNVDDQVEVVRKMQFMQKMQKEINSLAADIEDEML